MKKVISIVMLLIILLLFGTSFYYINWNEDILDVSIINLISTPSNFNRKHIRLNGVLEWEFEGRGIYLTKDDYNYGISENALWLDIDDELLSQKKDELNKMRGEYVIVEGIFNSKEKGHFDLYAGAIENVTRIERWKSRTERADLINNMYDKSLSEKGE